MCRQWGWHIFQAFEEHCKVETGGYATIRDVDELPAVHEDRMETFFLVRAIYSCLHTTSLIILAERDA